MQITGDQSKTLYSQRYQQTYHSKHGAVNESLQVFLRGAKVDARFENQQSTRVLEIGFGLGLNFALTADYAIQHSCQLEYVGVEHSPISAEQFADLEYAQWLTNTEPVEVVDTILRQSNATEQLGAQNGTNLSAVTTSQAARKNGFERTYKAALKHNGYLQLLVGDVTTQLLIEQLTTLPQFDAIYLDAFSPDVNPECWTLPFFGVLSQLLKPTGVLATYCVKGEVQRNLASAGFSVQKAPGPVGKREILSATLKSSQNHRIP